MNFGSTFEGVLLLLLCGCASAGGVNDRAVACMPASGYVSGLIGGKDVAYSDVERGHTASLGSVFVLCDDEAEIVFSFDARDIADWVIGAAFRRQQEQKQAVYSAKVVDGYLNFISEGPVEVFHQRGVHATLRKGTLEIRLAHPMVFHLRNESGPVGKRNMFSTDNVRATISEKRGGVKTAQFSETDKTRISELFVVPFCIDAAKSILKAGYERVEIDGKSVLCPKRHEPSSRQD